MEFAIIGKTKTSKNEIKIFVEKYGGKLTSTIHEKLTAVISTENEIEKMNKKMEDIKNWGIQVMPEDFLENVAKGNVVDYIKTNSICDWGTDVSIIYYCIIL